MGLWNVPIHIKIPSYLRQLNFDPIHPLIQLYLTPKSGAKYYVTYVSVRQGAKSNMSNSASEGSGNLSKTFCSRITWHVEQARQPSQAPSLGVIVH